eukprot:gene10387-21664_t
MSGWFFGKVENTEGAPASLPAEKEPKLDADEIRRRRLANLQLGSQAGVDKDSEQQQLKRERVEPQPSKPAAKTESMFEGRKNDLSSPEPTLKKPAAAPKDSPNQSEMSSPKRPTTSDINSRTLNLMLEQIFLMSLRKDTENDIKYMGHVGGTDGLLNASNISELICTRLISDIESGGAVGYLGACYKRLHQKESTATERIREELIGCRKQIISFMVTALTEDQMFGPNSESCDDDLLRLISSVDTTSTSAIPLLLKELTEELYAQGYLEQVILRFAEKCYQGLSLHSVSSSVPTPVAPTPPPVLGSRSMQMQMQQQLQQQMQMQQQQQITRSIVDELPSSFSALLTFCQADKRVPKVLVSFPHLLLDTARANAKPPQLMQAQMMFGVNFVGKAGVAGAAWEYHTLLGKILTIAPNADHPAVMSLLKDSHRQSKAAVDSKLASMRKSAIVVQAQAEGFILTLLKAGGEAKDLALSILNQILSVNIEAGKDRPSPLSSSSRPCLINVCGLCLRLCRPILKDPAKIGKIDWTTYFAPDTSVDSIYDNTSVRSVFPADETKLNTSEQTSTASSSSSRMDIDGKETKELNFITQSFFICWRALHLGVVPEYLAYPNLLRGLSRYHNDLRNDGREAVYYMTHKLCDVASFCAAACSSLYNNLITINNSSATSSSSMDGKMEGWLSPPESLTDTARDILSAIPEHIISDILEMLLFIA